MTDVNLFSLMDRFNCDENCREILEDIRWPDGPFCARCGAIDSRELPDGGKYYCRSCGYQFTVTSGTIMHDSHLPLRKWFAAIYLMCESKHVRQPTQAHTRGDLPYSLAPLPPHP